MVDKHAIEPELGSRNNSHTYIIEFVGKGKAVLDVGTSSGHVAKIMAEFGCQVTGIGVDPDAARQAEVFCEKVLVGDVESLDFSGELREGSFDVIVFGDVLEHLKDPLRAIMRLKPLLGPEGYVVASIPNVAHGSVRLALLQGKFRYQPLGLLDGTHLRFFTRESVEQLFEEAGFSIGELARTRRGVLDTEIEVDRNLVTGEALRQVQSDPEAETYQFVLTAYPIGEDGTLAKLSERVRLLSEQLSQKEDEIRQLNENAYAADNVQRQLNARNQQVADRERRIRSLNRELRHLGSVTAVAESSEALERARILYPAPNLDYREADLPRLPYPREHFGAVVAFGLIEKTRDPETTVAEMKRVLEQEGTLILSTPDKQVNSIERSPASLYTGELYIPELLEMLERHFDNVHLYRQGSVSGSLIFREDVAANNQINDPVIESTDFSSTVSVPTPGFPETRFVLAVCSNSEMPPPPDEQPYLLLDDERLVFEEHGDLREDVQLLREEIRRLQETEVQAFRDATRLRGSEIAYLTIRLKRLEERELRLKKLEEGELRFKRQIETLHAQNNALKEHLRSVVSSRTWRLFGPYRSLRAMLNSKKH